MSSSIEVNDRVKVGDYVYVQKEERDTYDLAQIVHIWSDDVYYVKVYSDSKKLLFTTRENAATFPKAVVEQDRNPVKTAEERFKIAWIAKERDRLRFLRRMKREERQGENNSTETVSLRF